MRSDPDRVSDLVLVFFLTAGSIFPGQLKPEPQTWLKVYKKFLKGNNWLVLKQISAMMYKVQKYANVLLKAISVWSIPFQFLPGFDHGIYIRW